MLHITLASHSADIDAIEVNVPQSLLLGPHPVPRRLGNEAGTTKSRIPVVRISQASGVHDCVEVNGSGSGMD
jgi:hypothetical protein